MDEDESIRCLNVDLEVWSREPLELLVEAFGDKVFVLHVGTESQRRHGAHLEVGGSGYRANADRLIRRMVQLVEKLPPKARRLWDSAQQRDFNIGIQGALKPRAFELCLQPKTLAAAARVNGRIVVTVYAAEPPRRKTMRVRTSGSQR